jgi:hypothetical protein
MKIRMKNKVKLFRECMETDEKNITSLLESNWIIKIIRAYEVLYEVKKYENGKAEVFVNFNGKEKEIADEIKKGFQETYKEKINVEISEKNITIEIEEE